MSEEYTLEDLKPIAANEYRQEPTGTYHTNRNGRRIPDTKGTEYVVTKVRKMPESEWYEHLRKAVKREGKEELLEQIKICCRKLAWLKTEKAIEKYALGCLSSEAYLAWPEWGGHGSGL